MKKILVTLLVLVTLLAGCKTQEDPSKDKPLTDYVDLPYYEYLNDTNPEVRIIFSDKSEIKLQLFPEIAPNTVNNFLSLAEENFYDGVIFHRIIKDFMMQGGDPQGTGTGGADYNIVGEFLQNNVENPLPHYRGVISMARSQSLNSASSQFFIVHKDSNFLDGQYAGFGAILEGFDVLDKFCNVETINDKPIDDIEIKDIIVNKKGIKYPEPLTISKLFFEADTYLDKDNPRVIITFENNDAVEVELFKNVAPKTVENFINLVNEGFYDETEIHRIIKDFAILGGAKLGDETVEDIKMIYGEFKANGFDNSLTHQRGVISMLRNETPDSATSQFFILQKDTPTLDGAYAGFGYIVSGIEIIDKIAQTEVDEENVPASPVIIKSIKIK